MPLTRLLGGIQSFLLSLEIHRIIIFLDIPQDYLDVSSTITPPQAETQVEELLRILRSDLHSSFLPQMSFRHLLSL